MNYRNNKEVRFDKYCKTCLYWGVPEQHDPCNACLSQPMNDSTEKPVEYKEADYGRGT